MTIMNSGFNLIFPPVQNIREKIFWMEEQLAEYFPGPFALFPLPNEAPIEMPRISATTHHGFSTLNISLNSIQLTSNFNSDFSGNWEKCESYLRERVLKIVNILTPLIKYQIYSGLTVNLMEKTEGEARNQLLKFSSNRDSLNKIHDIVTKYTFVADDTYYINIQLQNQRLLSPPVPGLLAKEEQSNLIGISLDINDRYAVNYHTGYFSDAKKIDTIFKLSSEVIKNKLHTFIYEGKLSI
jgi:hypothetical protein